MSKFLETFDEILEERGLSLTELSKISNINISTLLNYPRSNPTIITALKIVDYLHSSLDYFEQKIDYENCEFDKNYKINFFENLDKARKQQKIKVKTLCEETGIGESTYYDWKNGKLPRYENLITIANYLDCSIDELLGRHYVIKR